MDTSPHTSGFVLANGKRSDSVRLHYLDWGGNGSVLLFIPGMGCTAHIFDGFAPRFTDRFHVIAVTRHGHGESDYPETSYDPDTLAENLRQFLDALNIDNVILFCPHGWQRFPIFRIHDQGTESVGARLFQ